MSLGFGRVGLCGLAATVAAAFLYAPIFDADARAPFHAVLFDASASVVRPRPELARSWAVILDEERSRAASVGAEFLAATFDESVLDLGPEVNWKAPREPLSATRLDRALEALEPYLIAGDGHPSGTLVVVGDGTFTGPDPGPLLDRWASQGVRIESREPPLERVDRGLTDLVLPRAPTPGAPLAATVRLVRRGRPAPNESELTLTWTVGERSGRTVASADDRGLVRLELGPTPTEPTRVTIAIAAAGAARDPIPENDSAAAWVLPDERPLAWLVGDRTTAVAAGLRAAGFGVATSAVDALSAPASVELAARAQLLVTTEPLDEVESGRVHSFVQRGGGWLALAGPRTLERASDPQLPLSFEPAPDRARDVVLVVDASGSMAGEPYERALELAAELSNRVPPADRVRFAPFARALENERALEDSGVLARLAIDRPASGPTDLVGVVEGLVERAKSETRTRLAFVLTDGRDEVGRTPFERGALRAQLSAVGARIVPVAIGRDADVDGLTRAIPSEPVRRVAQGSEAGAAEGLIELLLEELRTDRVHAAVVVEPGVMTRPWEELSSAVAALDPFVLGVAARARLAAGAQALLITDTGEPVAAVVRRGAGRVGAIATGGEGWDAEVAALKPVLAALGRALSDPVGARPRLRREGQRLVATGLPGEAPPIVELWLTDGRGPFELAIPATAAGPDPRDRREGAWPAELAAAGPPLIGELRARSEGSEDSDGRFTSAVWLGRPPTDEFGGGPEARIRWPQQPPARGGASSAPHPAAPWIGLLGLLLLTWSGWRRFGRPG